MGHRLVIQPNGLYALYSSFVCDITLWDHTADDLADYYAEQAVEEERQRVARWVGGSHPGRKHHTVDEIVELVRLHHGDEQAELRRRQLMGEEDGNLADAATVDQIFHLLAERKETVAVAETGAGGRISTALTLLPGSSEWFLEGRVAYSHASKPGDPEVYTRYGSVSPEAAAEMAHSIRADITKTWGVAETSITGPEGGSEEKPVGTVVVAVSPPGMAHAAHTYHKVIEGTRRAVQEAAAEFALECLLGCLKKEGS